MKKSKILVALITVSSLTILNSCSSGTDNTKKEAKPEETPTEISEVEDVVRAYNTIEVDSTYIKNWENIRNNIDALNEVFAIGNKFSFTLSEASSSDSILAIPFINENKQFGFYILEAKDNTFIQTSFVSSSIETLPDAPRTDTKNKDNISYRTAVRRVNRWISGSDKQDWITFNVENKIVYNYFIINAMDIENSVQHDCFLSLRKDNSNSITSNGFFADIVIVNTKRKNVIKTETLEDVVHSVPPFHYSVN